MKSRVLGILCCLGLMGCGLFPARIKSGDVTVSAPKDNGKEATLDKGESKTAIDLPAGTKVITTKTESTATSPAVTVTEYDFTKPTHFEETSNTLRAGTGTIDTSVANHKIDVASREPFLYAAGVCGLACLFFVWRAYPTPAVLSAIAGAICVALWKITDLPPWVWGAAVAAGGVAFGLYHGHERGEKTAVAVVPVIPVKTP